MALKRILEEKGVLGWLNLDRVVTFGITVVELAGFIALFTCVTGLSAVRTVQNRIMW
jgi:hypothetical protein